MSKHDRRVRQNARDIDELRARPIGTPGAVTEAPSDGNEYVRKDGDWAVATGGSGNSYFPGGW